MGSGLVFPFYLEPVARVCLERKEVLQQLFARFGEHGFRMKLHSFNLMFAVAQPHDDAVAGLGADLKFLGQRLSLHNQRVIARRRKRIRDSSKNTFPVVRNVACLPMKQFGRAYDFPAKRRTNGLVP